MVVCVLLGGLCDVVSCTSFGTLPDMVGADLGGHPAGPAGLLLLGEGAAWMRVWSLLGGLVVACLLFQSSCLFVYPNTGALPSLVFVTVDFFEEGDVYFGGELLSQHSDESVQDWFLSVQGAGQEPIYFEDADTGAVWGSTIQATVSDSAALQLVFAFTGGAPQSAHLVLHGGLFSFGTAGDTADTTTLAWYGSEERCALQLDPIVRDIPHLPKEQAAPSPTWDSRSATTSLLSVSIENNTTLLVQGSVTQSGTTATLVVLEGLTVTDSGDEYVIKDPREITVAVADPRQTIQVTRLWKNMTNIREHVDGDSAYWTSALDEISQFECPGQCGARSLYSPGSFFSRHGLTRVGGYDINLAELGPTSSLVNNLNSTLFHSEGEDDTISLTTVSSASGQGWSVDVLWGVETARSDLSEGLLFINDGGVENMAAVAAELLGEGCGQLALTTENFLSQANLCDVSFATCLPPSLWDILEAATVEELPLVDAEMLLGTLAQAGTPRARLSPLEDEIVLEYKLAPLTVDFRLSLLDRVTFEQPIVRVEVDENSSCEWFFSEDILGLSGSQTRLTLAASNMGDIFGEALVTVSCSNGVTVVDQANGGLPFILAPGTTKEVALVVEPTFYAVDTVLASCEVAVEALGGLPLWSSEGLSDHCTFSIDLFDGMLLPLCSEVIQEPVVGFNDPLLPVASLESEGTLVLSVGSFGATELRVFLELTNAGDGTGRFDAVMECSSSAGSTFSVTGELAHTIPSIAPGQTTSVPFVLNSELAAELEHYCNITVTPIRLDDIQCEEPIGQPVFDHFTVLVIGGTFESLNSAPVATASPQPESSASPLFSSLPSGTATTTGVSGSDDAVSEPNLFRRALNAVFGERSLFVQLTMLGVLLAVICVVATFILVGIVVFVKTRASPQGAEERPRELHGEEAGYATLHALANARMRNSN